MQTAQKITSKVNNKTSVYTNKFTDRNVCLLNSVVTKSVKEKFVKKLSNFYVLTFVDVHKNR